MSKITAIDILEEAEYVYDPVCGFPHAYISDGLVSHNCVLFCVDGKTEVTLADGTTERIEDMYANTEKGATYTLKGVCPDTGNLISLPMRSIIRTQGKPMVKITSVTGNTIEVTTDHRLLVNRGGERVWVQAGELSVGDDLVEV